MMTPVMPPPMQTSHQDARSAPTRHWQSAFRYREPATVTSSTHPKAPPAYPPVRSPYEGSLNYEQAFTLDGVLGYTRVGPYSSSPLPFSTRLPPASTMAPQSPGGNVRHRALSL